MENILKFIRLTKLAEKIVKSDLDWETKYDLIFSDQISKKISETNINFEHHDPDTSYEDDVKSYVNSLTEKSLELQQLKLDKE